MRKWKSNNNELLERIEKDQVQHQVQHTISEQSKERYEAKDLDREVPVQIQH